uniref:Uncharacterized protein n=1 Tax=Promethearchaeum syntrophicum TaxID=2594042 RepID=A0A5B9DFG5_9ARCH|nr:hypothetical protein [Candidatus Prometheoarchaeum syntrophicum]QEE17761.1 hypothetical protein DSAG12_03599 [Candidatus Prometheoarchaeum syntrophicum]
MSESQNTVIDMPSYKIEIYQGFSALLLVLLFYYGIFYRFNKDFFFLSLILILFLLPIKKYMNLWSLIESLVFDSGHDAAVFFLWSIFLQLSLMVSVIVLPEVFALCCCIQPILIFLIALFSSLMKYLKKIRLVKAICLVLGLGSYLISFLDIAPLHYIAEIFPILSWVLILPINISDYILGINEKEKLTSKESKHSSKKEK